MKNTNYVCIESIQDYSHVGIGGVSLFTKGNTYDITEIEDDNYRVRSDDGYNKILTGFVIGQFFEKE